MQCEQRKSFGYFSYNIYFLIIIFFLLIRNKDKYYDISIQIFLVGNHHVTMWLVGLIALFHWWFLLQLCKDCKKDQILGIGKLQRKGILIRIYSFLVLFLPVVRLPQQKMKIVQWRRGWKFDSSLPLPNCFLRVLFCLVIVEIN